MDLSPSELLAILPEIALIAAGCLILLPNPTKRFTRIFLICLALTLVAQVPLLPEALRRSVVIGAIALGLALLRLMNDDRDRVLQLALLGVVLAWFANGFAWENTGTFFFEAYCLTPATAFLRALILLATGITLFLARNDKTIERHSGEVTALVLFTAAGGLLLVSSRHLALAYLAFEMLSVPSYALVGSIPSDARSTEGGLKYAVFGGAASAFLLFGFSLLYGMTGSLFFPIIADRLVLDPRVTFACLCIFVGAMYKLSAAPFHYWCPDAFEGAPFSVAGFLSVVPKIAGIGLVCLAAQYLTVGDAFARLIALAAVFSMTLGNLCALAQKNVKRLLAYSTIAHAGYILVAVSLLNAEGNRALLFYLSVYVVMNLGAFLAAGLTAPENTVAEFRGLGLRDPLVAFCMAVFLFSLVGLPPFGGFIAKLFVLQSALRSREYFLVGMVVVNTVISLYYYARILREMYIETSESTAPPLGAGLVIRGVLVVMAVALIVLGIAWEQLGDAVASTVPA